MDHVKDKVNEIVYMNINDIKKHPLNPRIHPDSAVDKLVKSIEEFGFTNPVLLSKDGVLLAGHARLKASEKAGLDKVPTITLDIEGAKADAYLIADNKLQEETGWDWPVLKDLLEELDTGDLDMSLTGFDEDEIEDLMTQFHEELDDDENSDDMDKEEAKKTLAERFGVPPFTILDTRQGYWQDRKRAWISLGIKSEVGRGGNLLEFSETAQSFGRGNKEGSARTFGQDLMKKEHEIGKQKQHVNGVLMKSDSGNDPAYYFKKQKMEKELGRKLSTEEFQEKYYEGPESYQSGTSIFDPVLCELSYSWYSPDGGTVIDPFAGGSVRGIVAGRLGRKYHGIDLREEQVEANKGQISSIDGLKAEPKWYTGDSTDLDKIIPADVKADFIFSCPPYADLEVYSDDPKDLSTMDYEEFLAAYKTIIKKAVDRLKDDRFACFVVGDVRDKKGFYRNFVADTIQAFLDAGMKYYNEAILINAIGSLPIRVGRQFASYRKLGKTHQNVLVFYKGNPKAIPEVLGEVSMEDLIETVEEESEINFE